MSLGNRDWGLLAEVKPIRLDDVDMVHQDATLLTLVLDEDQVLREIRLQEQELRAAAMHDHLTGLPNRSLLLNKVTQAIQRTKTEPDHRFAVVYFDLDRFKEINRGDEFVVLLDGVDDPEEPDRLARRLEADLSRPSHFRGREIVTTVSVGVTVSGAGHRDADDILRDADLAMYSVMSTRCRAGAP